MFSELPGGLPLDHMSQIAILCCSKINRFCWRNSWLCIILRSTTKQLMFLSKKEYCNLSVFGLELKLFPGTPACPSILHILNLPSLHKCVSQFLKIKYQSLFLSLSTLLCLMDFSSSPSYSGSRGPPNLSYYNGNFYSFEMFIWNKHIWPWAESRHWFPELWSKGYYAGRGQVEANRPVSA